MAVRRVLAVRPERPKSETPTADDYRALAQRTRWMAQAATDRTAKDHLTKMAGIFDQLARAAAAGPDGAQREGSRTLRSVRSVRRRHG